MSLALLLFHNVKIDFQRLEARYITELKYSDKEANGTATSSGVSGQSSAVDLNKRKLWGVNGAVTSPRDSSNSATAEPATLPYKLVWQGCPTEIYHAIDWTVDLLTSFRGTNWNFRIPTIPRIDLSLPPATPRSSNQSSDSKSQDSSSNQSKPTAVLKTDIHTLYLRGIRDFLTYYLLLDVLKTTMTTDPYFLGITPLSSPSPWPWLHPYPYTTRFVRLLMSLIGVFSALTFIFSLSPVFFTLILPRLISPSTITRAPLLEPSMYPPYWSSSAANFSPLTPPLENGLGGFWGQLWHQLFRYGISAPSKFVIEKYGIPKRSNTARAIQLLVAFGLTGTIHACAGYTTFSVTQSHPISGPFAFFVLQGFGIMAQNIFVKAVSAKFPAITKKVPMMVKKWANFTFALVFLFTTGPLLADDFARSGIWLFEPIPVSIFRGLGFGPGGVGEGWWCWGFPAHGLGGRVGIWDGSVREVAWWRKGVAVY